MSYNSGNVAPISPEMVIKEHQKSIPDSIINAFNKLIVKNYSPISKKATVRQDDVLNMVCGEDTFSRRTVFDNHWLDVEEIYREKGWDVDYDSPSYGEESFKAYFTFTIKKNYGKRED